MRDVRPGTDRSTTREETNESVEAGWLAGAVHERLAVRGLTVDVQMLDTVILRSVSLL